MSISRSPSKKRTGKEAKAAGAANPAAISPARPAETGVGFVRVGEGKKHWNRRVWMRLRVPGFYNWLFEPLGFSVAALRQ